MDTKSKKIKLQNIAERYYKYILLGIVICLVMSGWTYINISKYKSPIYGHSEEYRIKKSELANWGINWLDKVVSDIYKKTKYLSIFNEEQRKIHTYASKIKSGPVEYLVYNKEIGKYLTNSVHINNMSIHKYKEDMETVSEVISAELVEDNISMAMGTPFNFLINEMVNSKGETVQPYNLIKSPNNYFMYFWIPKSAMEPSGYFGIIAKENRSVKMQENMYKAILVGLVAILVGLIALTRISDRKKRSKALNKILLKRVFSEFKMYIFDFKSIPFKFTIVSIVIALLSYGVGYLYFMTFVSSTVEYSIFYTVLFCYIAVLIVTFIVCALYTIKLQRIIDSSENFSSNLFENKYKEKNLKKLSEGMEKMREGFKEAMDDQMKSERLKAELVTNISHDLKTPVTSIINYTDILLNKDITEEEKIDYLKVLNNKGLKLKLLIEDLFEISKISSGKEKIKKESVNLIELINQSLGELSSNIQESNIKFYVNSSNKDIMLELDGKKMSRVFENLISNITKYSLTGTRAYIDVSENDNTVNIAFKNISRDEINIDSDEIFNRFTRGDNSRNSKVEGSGLGLAIAKSIVDLHMGKMKVNIDGDLFKVEIKFPK